MSKASNDGWVSFWGSYLGGIIGGVGTLLALFISTKETRRVQDENKRHMEENEKERDRKNNRPLLVLEEKDLGSKWINRYYVATDDGGLYIVRINNVGVGIAKNVEIVFHNKETKKEELYKCRDVIAQGGYLEDIKIESSPYSIAYEEIDYDKDITIKYRDIFDNEYITTYILRKYYNNQLKITYVHIKDIINIGELASVQ